MKLLIFIIFLLLPVVLSANIRVVSQSDKFIELEYVLDNLQEHSIEIAGRNFTYFGMDDADVDGLPGAPALPQITATIAVPQGAKISMQILDDRTEYMQNTDVAPIAFFDREIKPYLNPDFYNQPMLLPKDAVSCGQPRLFRNNYVVDVKISPIQYAATAHQVIKHKSIRVKINFGNNTGSVSVGVFNQKEKDLARSFFLNPEQAEKFAVKKVKKLSRVTVNYDFSIGKWMKIPISEEGIYQITGSQLESAGYDLSNASIDNFHVYNYGGYALPYPTEAMRPQDLNEIAVKAVDADNDGIFDSEDKILFYGKGMGGWVFDENPGRFRWNYFGHPEVQTSTNNFDDQSLYPYDTKNYYIINFDSRSGKRIAAEESINQSGLQPDQNFTDLLHVEEDRYNILASGSDWYGEKFNGLSQNRSISFTLPQNLSDDLIRMYFRFKGGSGSLYGDNVDYKYYFKLNLNDQLVFDSNPSATLRSNNSTIFYIPRDTLFALKGGNNSLDIAYTGNYDGCEAFLDYFEFHFQRPFISENNFLRFRTLLQENTPKQFNISNLPGGSNTVWDITNPVDIVEINPIQNGSNLSFQDVSAEFRPSKYFVFANAAIKNVASFEEIENHANLRDPSRRGEFLIITPDEFYDAAEFLEVLRETQIPDPVETERIKLSEIFQEFSSGVRDITAIRDFLKYVNENWSDTLKYVLLFGDGHYDYRNIHLTDYVNYMPPFEIANMGEVNSRESDNFYVAFYMTGNLDSMDPWVPIGRVPVNSLEQIETFRDKITQYAKSYLIDPDGNGWQTNITLVSDDEIGSSSSTNELPWHLNPTEQINRNYIPDKFDRSKIYLHDYDLIPGGLGRWKPKATEKLLNQINKGTLLISYFGHGSPDTWAHESVLNRSRDLQSFHNKGRLPLWVAATCTWGKYDDPTHTSMSEELVVLPEKGGIAVISAARPVFVTSNVTLATNFYKNLFRNKSETLPSRPLGEALFLAMKPSTNYQKYHLFGDPSMQLTDPRFVIKIDSVTPDTLKALSVVNVQASVAASDGSAISDFSGKAVLQAYDAIDSMYTNINNINLSYEYAGGTIFKGFVTVTDGQLSGNFIVPKSIKYKNSKTGRLSIYAWDESGKDAVGFVDSLLFYGTSQGSDDQAGPEIHIAFQESPSFFDGDFLSNQPTLEVEISDDSGINLTGEVGHKIELTIDNALKKDITEFFVYDTDNYQSGKLVYTLPAMTTGRHELKLSCWDNLNNYSEQIISFRTNASDDLQLSEVVNYPNPFGDETWFTFQLVSPVSEADVVISIYTVTGRKIQEIRDVAHPGFNKLPSTGPWDARDWDGDYVANGVYLYKIEVDNGEKKVEKIEKLAIVR